MSFFRLATLGVSNKTAVQVELRHHGVPPVAITHLSQPQASVDNACSITTSRQGDQAGRDQRGVRAFLRLERSPLFGDTGEEFERFVFFIS
jgi:hypothetical protein